MVIMLVILLGVSMLLFTVAVTLYDCVPIITLCADLVHDFFVMIQ
jgi:hypothetical protein